MSTSQQIADIWRTYVFDHADIQDITTKVYDYQLTVDSEREITKWYYNQRINCVTYLTQYSTVFGLTEQEQREYLVTVTYYKQVDTDGTAYKAVRDFFETLKDLVLSELGHRWQETVDFYNPPSETPEISEIEIGGEKCWQGQVVYQAFKTVSI